MKTQINLNRINRVLASQYALREKNLSNNTWSSDDPESMERLNLVLGDNAQETGNRKYTPCTGPDCPLCKLAETIPEISKARLHG